MQPRVSQSQTWQENKLSVSTYSYSLPGEPCGSGCAVPGMVPEGPPAPKANIPYIRREESGQGCMGRCRGGLEEALLLKPVLAIILTIVEVYIGLKPGGLIA